MNKVKKTRESKNMTIAKLAELTYCSVTILRGIEANEIKPNIGVKQRIANAFSMSIYELF